MAKKDSLSKALMKLLEGFKKDASGNPQEVTESLIADIAKIAVKHEKERLLLAQKEASRRQAFKEMKFNVKFTYEQMDAFLWEYAKANTATMKAWFKKKHPEWKEFPDIEIDPSLREE